MSSAPLSAASARFRKAILPSSHRPGARALRIGVALALIAVTSMVLALSVGSSGIGVSRSLAVLFQPDATTDSMVIHQLRLPRAMAAFAVGGLLAYSGALMQVLLRNPLADPYILGLSGGSSVGALGAMLLGLGAFLVDLGAFAGALATIVLVFALSGRDMASARESGPDATPRMLLTGVMLGAGWSAIATIILLVSPEAKLRGMLFWLMGDLAGAQSLGPPLIALGLLVALMFPLGRQLNAMLRGSEVAFALGVPVRGVRRMTFVAASLAAAIAVTTAGAVGFVGLVMPHALRLVIGNDQRLLLPACALGGGSLLVIADTVARTAFAPEQLPVGVVMAVLGVPVFMLLLLRGRR